jgi:hypothetical protein
VGRARGSLPQDPNLQLVSLSWCASYVIAPLIVKLVSGGGVKFEGVGIGRSGLTLRSLLTSWWKWCAAWTPSSVQRDSGGLLTLLLRGRFVYRRWQLNPFCPRLWLNLFGWYAI